jgi:subtilisin family serine protease
MDRLSRRTLRRLTVCALLLCLCSASFFIGTSRVAANDDGRSGSGKYTGSAVDKCSPDLIAIVNADPNARVKAIVQASGSSSGLLDSLLDLLNATTLLSFPNLNARLVDITAGAAQTLAYQDGISYMSIDNRVTTFGHITDTTGTQQSRSQKNLLGLGYTLDGSNVNVAVVDSGIDGTHKSFSRGNRIVFSKDFAGGWHR